MSDPHEPGGISVTIKGDEPGGKYNDAKKPGTWIVFHGSPAKIREQICEVFQIDGGDRPLYDLINEATDTFKASATVSSSLGGRVLSQGNGGASAEQQVQGDGGDVWAQAAAAKAQQPQQPQESKEDVDPILAALETCKSVAEVQQVWAENQAAFNSNPAYMEAYKAKGKALSSAA
jgi:hypothetical protein